MSSLVKNSLLYLVSNICIKATSFFLLPFYSHLVSPEIYGYIYVVSALSNFLVMLLPLSMYICISRFYFDCKDDIEVKKLYTTILFFVFISASVIITPFATYCHQLSSFLNIPQGYLNIALITAYMNVFYQVILSLLYVCQQAKKVSITSTCIGVLQIVVQLTLVIYMEDKGYALLLTLLLSSLSSFLIFIIYSIPYLCVTLEIRKTIKYLKYSLSQFPSDVSGWLVNFTDRIFINKYIGSYSAGVYGIGANIGQIPVIIYSSMNSAFTPHINSQYKAIEEASSEGSIPLRNGLSRVFLIVSSILIVLMTLLIAFANNIVSLLSPLYSDAFFVVVLMLIAALLNDFRCMYMAPLAYNIKYTKVKSLIWIIAGLINIFLNWYFIPIYGIYSACINSIITYLITFLLMLYYGNKAFYIKYDWYRLAKVLFFSLPYCLLLLLGISYYILLIKLLLIVPYIYVVFNFCLNLDINIITKRYVKNIFNKF